MTGDWESAAAARDLKNAMDADPAQLVILPDPTIKLMPFVLALMAMIWVGLASFIPDIPLLGRIAAVAVSIGFLTNTYLTTARRLVVGEDAVDIELTRKRVRIPYANLDHVVVRARPIGRRLSVVFVTRNPRSTITTQVSLMRNDVLRIAPRLIRALTIRGVAVEVPGTQPGA